MRLGTQLHQRSLSTVFRVRDAEKVIKYEMSCSETNGIHPLLHEFWFLQYLEESGIVPHVDLVSPAVAIPRFVGIRKTSFEMSRKRQERCAERPHAAVRYLVMDLVGPTLARLIKANVEASVTPALGSVFDLLKTMLEGLRIMHYRGVIHGDIHADNVARLNDGTTGFIDFGLSRFSDDLSCSRGLSGTGRD